MKSASEHIGLSRGLLGLLSKKFQWFRDAAWFGAAMVTVSSEVALAGQIPITPRGVSHFSSMIFFNRALCVRK